MRRGANRNAGRPEDRGVLWAAVAHIVCCGGAALVLLFGGAAITAAGAVRASFWLLVAGLVVALGGWLWLRARSGDREARS